MARTSAPPIAKSRGTPAGLHAFVCEAVRHSLMGLHLNAGTPTVLVNAQWRTLEEHPTGVLLPRVHCTREAQHNTPFVRMSPENKRAGSYQEKHAGMPRIAELAR